jgi:diguanylate cyclase (GGDEF)-like protein
VLDERGTIVAVNEEWKRFARLNGGDHESGYVGTDYLAVCRDAVRRGGDLAALAILEGIEDLMLGKRERVAVEYPCHSPAEERWFVAYVTRLSHGGEVYIVTAHEDFTARKVAEDRVQQSEAVLRSILEALPVGVWIMNEQGQIVHGNPASQKIWAGARYVGPEQFGEYKGWWLSTGKRIAAEEWAAARAIRKGEISLDEEIRIECFDGTTKIILNSAVPLRDAGGNINGAIVVNQDITSRNQMEAQLFEAKAAIEKINLELQRVLAREQVNARTDDLTGLSNRRHFFEVGGALFAAARRYQTPLSVVLFDIDHFKLLNDKFGHRVGDSVLQAVARISRERMREADGLARYGGEEFIAILPNTTSREALMLTESLRERIATHRQIANEAEVSLTISAGISEMRSGGDTLERLIERADQALYAAKNSGRNCSRVL